MGIIIQINGEMAYNGGRTPSLQEADMLQQSHQHTDRNAAIGLCAPVCVALCVAWCAALILALSPLRPAQAADSPSIGTVAKQRLDVYGTPPGGERKRKFPRYDVVHGELIETSGGAAILIRMLDQTELYLGERASLTIDEFVYDPDNNTGDAVFDFTVGTLRFVSGAMQGAGVTIQTPNTHIGIRGSEAIIFVTPDGDTFVNVIKGRFSVRSRESPDAPAVAVGAGKNVSHTRAKGFSAVGQGVAVPDYSHDPSANVPDFSDDLKDLKDGGGLDKAREGSRSGDRSSDGHSDSGGHHDAPD